MVGRNDFQATNHCPKCYKKNFDEVTGEIEGSILINALLNHIEEHSGKKALLDLVNSVEVQSNEEH